MKVQPAGKSCGVCAAAAASYRCPRCDLRYCSVACCRTHKETCSNPGGGAASKPPAPAADGSGSNLLPVAAGERVPTCSAESRKRSRMSVDDLCEGNPWWRLDDAARDRLDSGADWARRWLLEAPALRAAVFAIDAAEDPFTTLQRALNPVISGGDAVPLREFVDELLRVIKRLDDSGPGGTSAFVGTSKRVCARTDR